MELAWDGEHSVLIQDRAAAVGASVSAVVSSDPSRQWRRATDKKVADGMQASSPDASKLILASGISAESVKPTGFGFVGASSALRLHTIRWLWHIWQFCWWQNHGCCQLRLRKPSTDLRNHCSFCSCQQRKTKESAELPDFTTLGIVVDGSGECDQLDLMICESARSQRFRNP